jgi:hypothetical protein
MSIVPEMAEVGQWLRKSLRMSALRGYLQAQRFRASAASKAAPAAIPATASPVRFIDFWIAA